MCILQSTSLSVASHARRNPVVAATVEFSKYFGLTDRGVVEVGKRADLILINGDPLIDIKNTRDLQRIWCKGIEMERA